jgi:Na+-transporting methylmalonyl-CoA/oxaloacetate decarboxylase gamma subunit
MTQWEAWIVTGLGMAVVFIGLVLCIAFIQLFSRLARHVTWGEASHGGPAALPEPAAVPVLSPQPSEPVPAELLAVISALLEVESKLYLNRPGSRVTIRRTGSRP